MTPSLRDALREQNIDPREFAWGEVYWCPDAELRFPPTPADKRVTKEHRPVVVLHNEVLSQHVTYPVVLVAPISSEKLKRRGPLDLGVPSGEAGLKLPSIVHIGLLQPVLKVWLGTRLGRFSEQYCELLEGLVLKALLRAPPEEEEEICEAEYDPFAEE